MCKHCPYCAGVEVLHPAAIATIPDFFPKNKFPTKYISNAANKLQNIPFFCSNDFKQVWHTHSADLLPGLSKWLALQWSYSSWDNIKPIYNPQAALSTHYFNANCRATLWSQAALVDSSLGPRYISLCWGLHDRISAMMLKGSDQYTIYMGNSFICYNQRV